MAVKTQPFDRFCKYTCRNSENHKSRPLQCESFNSNVDLVSYEHSTLMKLQCEGFNSDIDLVSYRHLTLMLTANLHLIYFSHHAYPHDSVST